MDLDPFTHTPAAAPPGASTAPDPMQPDSDGPLCRRLREIAAARYRAGACPPRSYFWFTTPNEMRATCAPSH